MCYSKQNPTSVDNVGLAQIWSQFSGPRLKYAVRLMRYAIHIRICAISAIINCKWVQQRSLTSFHRKWPNQDIRCRFIHRCCHILYTPHDDQFNVLTTHNRQKWKCILLTCPAMRFITILYFNACSINVYLPYVPCARFPTGIPINILFFFNVPVFIQITVRIHNSGVYFRRRHPRICVRMPSWQGWS